MTGRDPAASFRVRYERRLAWLAGLKIAMAGAVGRRIRSARWGEPGLRYEITDARLASRMRLEQARLFVDATRIALAALTRDRQRLIDDLRRRAGADR